jgi:2-dehydropantoate 2-reductase
MTRLGVTPTPAIAVLGPGGVGGFIAAALARAGAGVLVIAREPTAEVIARHGIAVESVRIGDFTVRPAVATALSEPSDYLIIATKATGLASALSRIEAVPDLIVPLLNGLDHVAALRARFGADRVAAGAIRIEADRPAPGRIVQTSPFLRVDLAADDPALRPALERLQAILEPAGIPCRIGVGEAQILWSKLVRLCALACTTSASGRRLGFIRSDPEWRPVLEACVLEAAAVANAEGAGTDPAHTFAELDDAHPELGSSMQRDLDAGREPELDAIAGAVLRAGTRHGLACPTIEGLVAGIAARMGG